MIKASPLEFDYSGLTRVISGGQTGSDQGGLAAGRKCGLETGGMAPKGYRTADGPHIYMLRDVYGLSESESEKYPPRTEWNVVNSDGTIRLASNFESPGEILTIRFIKRHKKPYIDILLPIKDDRNVEKVVEWIIDNQISTLNVAGNRDFTQINTLGFHHLATYNFLYSVFVLLQERLKHATIS